MPRVPATGRSRRRTCRDPLKSSSAPQILTPFLHLISTSASMAAAERMMPQARGAPRYRWLCFFEFQWGNMETSNKTLLSRSGVPAIRVKVGWASTMARLRLPVHESTFRGIQGPVPGDILVLLLTLSYSSPCPEKPVTSYLICLAKNSIASSPISTFCRTWFRRTKKRRKEKRASQQ